MPFPQRSATAPDPNARPSLFEWKNLVNALVIASLSAGALAATLYAPRWPIPCAIISLFIVAFATVLRISLITTTVITPSVRIVSNLPLSQPEPLAASEQEIVTHDADTTVVVDPPAPALASSYQRAPSGRFVGHRVVDEPVVPVPPVQPA